MKDKNDHIDETMSKIARLCGAGLCQFSAEGKHQFLKDISDLLKKEGYDILGDKTGE